MFAGNHGANCDGDVDSPESSLECPSLVRIVIIFGCALRKNIAAVVGSKLAAPAAPNATSGENGGD